MGWGKGAVHPNGSNFRRALRWDIVSRARKLCETGLLQERPKWLEWAERVPPMENSNLNLQVRKIRNPYPQMIGHLLKKHPDLRFQDCYVDGNDWSAGNDRYRDDHPVMQFVARQLDFMNQGMSKKEAFKKAEDVFRERREYLEREQKVMMAMAMDSGLQPMFTTGSAYLQNEKAKAETAHLQKILQNLRKLKQDQDPGEQRKSIPERRMAERARQQELSRQRVNLVGVTADALEPSPQSSTVGDTPDEAEDYLTREEEEDTVASKPISADDAMSRLSAPSDEVKADVKAEEGQAPSPQIKAAKPMGDIEGVPYTVTPRRPTPQPSEEGIAIRAAKGGPRATREKPLDSVKLGKLTGFDGGVLGEDANTGRGGSQGRVDLDDFEDDDLDDAADSIAKRRNRG